MRKPRTRIRNRSIHKTAPACVASRRRCKTSTRPSKLHITMRNAGEWLPREQHECGQRTRRYRLDTMRLHLTEEPNHTTASSQAACMSSPWCLTVGNADFEEADRSELSGAGDNSTTQHTSHFGLTSFIPQHIIHDDHEWRDDAYPMLVTLSSGSDADSPGVLQGTVPWTVLERMMGCGNSCSCTTPTLCARSSEGSSTHR